MRWEKNSTMLCVSVCVNEVSVYTLVCFYHFISDYKTYFTSKFILKKMKIDDNLTWYSNLAFYFKEVGLSEVPAPAAAGGTVGAAPAAGGGTAGCLGPAAAGGGPAEAAGVCSIVGLFALDAGPCSNNKP